MQACDLGWSYGWKGRRHRNADARDREVVHYQSNKSLDL